MDKMDTNLLWDLVEKTARLVYSAQRSVSLDESKEDEEEISICLQQLDGAVCDLTRALASFQFDKR